MTTTAVRDQMICLPKVEIPRPKFNGMEFVQTRGRMGIYRTLRAHGIQMQKPPRSMRPALSSDLFTRPATVREEDVEHTVSPPPAAQSQVNMRRSNLAAHSDNDDSSRSSQLSNYSSSSSHPPSPFEVEPDYPSDYVPRHLKSNASTQIRSTSAQLERQNPRLSQQTYMKSTKC